ncbi:MAG TPA: carboxypeptidase regulatory-like domain-containing protein [Blastocatellia bacterium]|nr:carboxypeptidase regulatory-like domain-containing protein [Blastocatellia bacterium]
MQLFGTSLIRKASVALAALSLACLLAGNAIAQSRALGGIRVTMHDESERPVAGVLVQLKSNGAAIHSVTSNEKGEVEFANVAAGVYEVAVSKDSFEPLNLDDVTVTSGATVEVRFAMVPKVQISDTVNVSAGSTDKVERSSSPSTELQRAEIKSTPIKPATVADTLPLVPGVVRSSEGEIRISGAGEHRSALVVNSADVTDPATGQFGVTVPVDSVETISVFKTPYLAQFGRFTAGVVSVETRRGGEKWNFELNDPLPEYRIRSGHLRGIKEASPRVVFNGPLIKDKLYFSEGLEYDLKKEPVKTLPFPFNETKQESVNSFTQLDYILSPIHTLTGTFHVAPRHMNFVNLSFFNPQEVTPTFRARDYTGTLIDRLTIGSSLLESTVAIKRFTGNVWGQGLGDMVLTPEGNSGNYFSQQDRRASRLEWLEIFSVKPINVMGAHNLKFGTTLAHTTNRGSFDARPVSMETTDGRPVKRIDFVGGRPFDRGDIETGFFGQDHWVVTPKLAVDVGTRFEYQGITETFRVAPRIGLALTPFAKSQTTIRGGFGLFYDRVPLSVYSFDRYPEQVITTFGPDGTITGVRRFANITDKAEAGAFPFVFSPHNAGNFSPYSATWNVEVEHPINNMLRVRANFLQSNSFGTIVFTPKTVQGRDALVLSGGGKSGYRQLELTARMTLKDGQQMFFSYVRSRARGDLNEFNSYLGNFPFPVVRPNEYTNLPGDLPNRFLAWGTVSLPWKMRISPMIEWRNGFPFATTNVAQEYVGTPNTNRYPAFYSVDSRVSKDFKLNDKYSVRFSVSGFNLTNHFNPLDVHSNIDDLKYGVFFGNHKRRFRLDFDVLF